MVHDNEKIEDDDNDDKNGHDDDVDDYDIDSQ